MRQIVPLRYGAKRMIIRVALTFASALTLFGTKDAAIARTTYNTLDAPIQTVFQDAFGAMVSEIRYTCDEEGRILKAVQYNGPGSISDTLVVTDMVGSDVMPRGLEAFSPDAEQFGVTFLYDQAGSVIRQETSFAGERIHCTISTYNEYGDLLTSTTDDQSPVRCEYEYDTHQNWTKKRVYFSEFSQPDEYRQRFIYYVDGGGPAVD